MNLYDNKENDLLIDMVISLLEQHTGITVSDQQRENIFKKTALLRCQPINGAHIANIDLYETKEYLRVQSMLGKTQVVFFGSDELLQDFSLEKVQRIAEKCKDYFNKFFYLTDDLKADEIYAKFCAESNREPLLTMWGGIHYAFHDPTA